MTFVGSLFGTALGVILGAALVMLAAKYCPVLKCDCACHCACSCHDCKCECHACEKCDHVHKCENGKCCSN